MTPTRTTHEGACNEPQPWNWSNACARKPGHDGEHHTKPDGRGLVLSWTEGGMVSSVHAARPSEYACRSRQEVKA